MSSSSYKGGSLSRVNEKRLYPAQEVKGISTRSRTIKLEVKEIMIVTDPNISNQCLNMVLAYYVSRFYNLADIPNVEHFDLIASIAGILGNCSDWASIKPWGTMVEGFRTAGIELKIKELTYEKFKEKAQDDERTTKFLDPWFTDLKEMMKQSHLVFVLSCCILLTMAKNLGKHNFFPWMKRRIQTFSGTVGDLFTPANITEANYPDMGLLQILFQFCSANHEFRKTVYLSIVSLAVGPRNFISSAMAEIHHLMRGHEIQHLLLIDKYIFEEHPEFLGTTLLRGLNERFASAIALLKKYPLEEVMYIKILYDKDTCASLNRQIFEKAATVATTIAQLKNSTFENFYQSSNTSHNRIREMVREYFTLRYSAINAALVGRDRSAMPQMELDMLSKEMVRRAEEKWMEEKREEETQNIILLPNEGNDYFS